MSNVEAEENHGKDVPGRHVPNAEARNHVLIDLAFFEIGAGMHDARCEMQQVIDDEAEEDRAAPIHRARGVTGDDVLLAGVAFGARVVVFERQANACPTYDR